MRSQRKTRHWFSPSLLATATTAASRPSWLIVPPMTLVEPDVAPPARLTMVSSLVAAEGGPSRSRMAIPWYGLNMVPTVNVTSQRPSFIGVNATTIPPAPGLDAIRGVPEAGSAATRMAPLKCPTSRRPSGVKARPETGLGGPGRRERSRPLAASRIRTEPSARPTASSSDRRSRAIRWGMSRREVEARSPRSRGLRPTKSPRAATTSRRNSAGSRSGVSSPAAAPIFSKTSAR